MYKFRKKRNIIPMVFLFFCGFLSQAQEPEEKPPENSIFCAELELEVDGFEAIEPSIIRVCCGGPFQEATIPCKIISKASYESFTGQSDAVSIEINQGIQVTQLLEPKKDKLSKIRSIEVINSSTQTLANHLKIAIKKGVYPIDNEGKVWLEVEYLK
jgi:hypothetical protein